ncbi:MAG: hypothetical protein A2Y64_03915 [Candidatus Coatesbacteria bacterium RBG_13_66_14]|uniref:SbsA Ig-like domain-containing protein n=1 Tax=Candidatus Coatesbacteria bacterium RBG_13_66_14 TaxID=1817816 RepID=A0A1F5F768_9BACT|nr:MAG: hypothetical protein A2Y64_03915 [Candidatus Coatesbacteria bacterium RBG_13_66_14]
MRGKAICLVSFFVLAGSALGGTWVQTSWVDGGSGSLDDLWNAHQRSFYQSQDLAWWRYVSDSYTGDNFIFPYAPREEEVDVFGEGDLQETRTVNCGTVYKSGDDVYLVLGGRDSAGFPCIYFSKDQGVNWEETRDTTVTDGAVFAVAQQPGSDRLHLLANTTGGQFVRIYILDNLQDTGWNLEDGFSAEYATHASFLFESGNRGFLTIANIYDHLHEKVWRWDGANWTPGPHEFDREDQLYGIWRMGDGRLYIAADRGLYQDDRCFYSTDDGATWENFSTDYFPGATDFPRFVAVGPGFGWDGKYAYLTSSEEGLTQELCRIEFDDPTDFETFTFAGSASLDAILVGDDGVVYVAGSSVAGACLWYSTDDGESWSGGLLEPPYGGLSALPALFQDPRYGFLYLSGNWLPPDSVPFIVFMASHGASIESLPYDCGESSQFNFIQIQGQIEDYNQLEVFLRSSNNADMEGALDWNQCGRITDYNNLGDVAGLNDGDRYVQYRLVFHGENDVPLSFPAVDSFLLDYAPEGEEPPVGPIVLATVPPDGASDVPLNAKIWIKFDHRMDLESFKDNFYIYADDGATEIDWTGKLEGDGFEFIAEPDPALPPSSEIQVLLDSGITDSDGVPIQDQNGDGEGAFDFTFGTGGEGDIDDEPPVVSNVKANPNPTFGADVVSLTCRADDTDRGGSFIAGGEYFVDDAGADGEGMPLTAADGNFDSSFEELLALVDASGWETGSTHVLYVHARDAAGNWSPLQSVVVETEGEFLDPSRTYVWPNPAGDAAHFAFTLGGNARVVLVVYDLAGREVHRQRGEFNLGEPGAFVWNLDGVASDVYIFRLTAEEIGGMGRSASVVKKLAVVR